MLGASSSSVTRGEPSQRRPAAHGAMDSAKKKTRSQCFLPGPATDVWIQTCRTSHPYGTAWNLFLSLGEPPFVRDWARAAFSYPSLLSCAEIVWPAWLPPICLHHKNLMLIGTVSLRLVPRALRTSAPRYRKWITGSREGRTGEGARWGKATRRTAAKTCSRAWR